MDNLILLITAAGIPSAIVSLFFWNLKRKIEKTEKNREEQQRKQEALQVIILDSLNGTINLAEATARAVSRIPDAHCNGDMHKALKDIEETKKRQQKMILNAGVHDILCD